MADTRLNTVEQKQTSPLSQWLTTQPGKEISLMAYLYRQFAAMYPGRWNVLFSNAESIQDWHELWAAAFERARLTPEQVLGGIRRCPEESPSRPPQLGEFIAICRMVKPAAHREFAPMVTEKLTPEKIAENRRRVREAMEVLTRKTRMPVDR